MISPDDASLSARISRAVQRWPMLNPQEFEHLVTLAARFPPDEQLDSLMVLFVDPPENAYLAQEYAGQLLRRLKPPCPYPLDVLLQRVLPKWNRSIEQLPAYLVEIFGPAAVLQSLARLDETSAIDPEISATVRCWLRVQGDRPG